MPSVENPHKRAKDRETRQSVRFPSSGFQSQRDQNVPASGSSLLAVEMFVTHGVTALPAKHSISLNTKHHKSTKTHGVRAPLQFSPFPSPGAHPRHAQCNFKRQWELPPPPSFVHSVSPRRLAAGTLCRKQKATHPKQPMENRATLESRQRA